VCVCGVVCGGVGVDGCGLVLWFVGWWCEVWGGGWGWGGCKGESVGGGG